MHIHNVYFWLADGLDSESLAAYLLNNLGELTRPRRWTFGGTPSEPEFIRRVPRNIEKIPCSVPTRLTIAYTGSPSKFRLLWQTGRHAS